MVTGKRRMSMGAQRWAAEHSAKGAPIGIVLYDDDDDIFTVKTKDGEWVTYSRDRYQPLDDSDIDGDSGDQIVGQLETRSSVKELAPIQEVDMSDKVPTLGEISNILKDLKDRRVTLESLLYIAREKVWWESK
jgi:hypothetical protein